MHADDPIDKLIKLTSFGYDPPLILQALRLLKVRTIKDLYSLNPEKLLHLSGRNQEQAEYLYLVVTKWLEVPLVQRHCRSKETQKDAPSGNEYNRSHLRKPSRQSRAQHAERLHTNEPADESVEKLIKLTLSGYESLLLSQALQLLSIHTIKDLQGVQPERLLHIPALNQKRAARLFKILTQWMNHQRVQQRLSFPEKQKRDALPPTRTQQLVRGTSADGLSMQLVSRDGHTHIPAQPAPSSLQILQVETPNRQETEKITDSLPLSILSTRDREVITSRFGLDGTLPETLETIGLRLGITRERVRQLEARALRKLREEKSRTQVQEFFQHHEQDVWQILAGSQNAVSTSQVLAQSKQLPGELLLALTMLYDSPINWLNAVAKRTSHGWYRGDYSVDDLASWQQRLREYCEPSALPRPLISLITTLGLQEQQLTAAVTLMPDFYVFLGYLTDGKPTRRRRRCIRAHLLLSCECRSQPTLVEDLRDLYRNRYQDDQCTARDLEIVMIGAAHLFLKLHEAGWTALNTVIPLDSMLTASPQGMSEDLAEEDFLDQPDDQELPEREPNEGAVPLPSNADRGRPDGFLYSSSKVYRVG